MTEVTQGHGDRPELYNRAVQSEADKYENAQLSDVLSRYLDSDFSNLSMALARTY